MHPIIILACMKFTAAKRSLLIRKPHVDRLISCSYAQLRYTIMSLETKLDLETRLSCSVTTNLVLFVS